MPKTDQTDRDRLLSLARERNILTAREVTQAGIHSQQLTRLVEEGILERIGRGRYRLDTGKATEHHGLVMASKAVPKGVVCLLSALSFHEIGTQLPHQVWIAIERGTRKPQADDVPLRVVQFSDVAFSEEVEVHEIEGEPVRIYSLAKTVADLFKYRNKIGLDVAIEALREGWHMRTFTIGELTRAAGICRVGNVIRPYVETVIS